MPNCFLKMLLAPQGVHSSSCKTFMLHLVKWQSCFVDLKGLVQIYLYETFLRHTTISKRKTATVCAILLWKQIYNFCFSCNRFKKKEKRFSNHTADQCCHCFPCTLLPGLSRPKWLIPKKKKKKLHCSVVNSGGAL